MRRILYIFLIMPSLAWAQMDPAMLQQGIGTAVGLIGQVKDLKEKRSGCQFTSSDENFVFDLMVEYNKEILAADGTFMNGADSAIFNTNKITYGTTECSDCISLIEKNEKIDRKIAVEIISKLMNKWSTSDFTKDELERINKIRNPMACAGETIKVLGGVKEQVLTPLLGNLMPGAEGMMGDGGLGNITNLLGGAGAQ